MEIEPHQILPDDLVLEIIARSSPATIIRCGAISKPLRRRILHPAFLRRLRVVNAGDDTGNSRCGFVPSLLLGLYRRAKDLCSPLALVPPDTAGAASIATSLALVPPATPINHGANHSACIFGPYLPLSSRRSLIVLRRRCKVIGHQDYLHSGLTVCNPVSGERWVLPPHEVSDETVVLLDVNHNDQAIGTHSFKLLAAQLLVSPARTLIFQVFSSDEREWGHSRCLPHLQDLLIRRRLQCCRPARRRLLVVLRILGLQHPQPKATRRRRGAEGFTSEPPRVVQIRDAQHVPRAIAGRGGGRRHEQRSIAERGRPRKRSHSRVGPQTPHHRAREVTPLGAASRYPRK
uniref:F-box domain-containing protein n=1 Tax=Oryza glaberrima TaxID=4538 RepID=I1NQ26_ORYGL